MQMMGVNQSAAISQQFIEVLADLPWSRSSADAVQEAAAAAAAAHAGAHTPSTSTPTTSSSSAASPDRDAGAAGGSGSSPQTPSAVAAARHRRGGTPKPPRRGMVQHGKPAQNGVGKDPGHAPENQQGGMSLAPPVVPLAPLSLSEARKMLDAHHFGLDKIKDR
ncbi:hypothetical protein DUNSADRAFT_10272 [Dunaliella salina]|uniref:Encoded protein n=1 Tax=Dunaliella salina TaxID=3046 RepID=A0ABQ7GFM4_DUNSA|nr:hypothetical protein DUNSADRAFT_10272 [Dunaliella salina]|eukprot:KAF5833403.1 hypothetical protein DUNSADRAFT_10272 [Dunaliella salina]